MAKIKVNIVISQYPFLLISKSICHLSITLWYADCKGDYPYKRYCKQTISNSQHNADPS